MVGLLGGGGGRGLEVDWEGGVVGVLFSIWELPCVPYQTGKETSSCLGDTYLL